jgi:diadenosine tetraphosphate (Ap4A) HIT family hydrolase
VHKTKKEDCPFCADQNGLLRNELAYVRADKFAVSAGHMLVIPLRHLTSFFELTRLEREALTDLLVTARELVEEKHKPDGYNIGINVGEAAGQTIAHVHVHLIPRYKGDVPNPRGGVRGVIPGKRNY